MKRSIILALFIGFTATAASAADAPKKVEPPKITCGNTLAECQKVVDDLTNKLAMTTLTAAAFKTQRDQARAASDDAQVNAYVAEQAAKAAGDARGGRSTPKVTVEGEGS